MVHLRRYPEAVLAGLKIISESTRLFIEAARQTGIAGIFFAVQHAQYGMLSVDEYKTFGRSYDLQVLEQARDLWLNLLHLHGEDVMFDQFLDYPVAVINWHDRDTSPSLSEAQARFPGVVCGGLSRERSMVLGTPEQVTAEAKDAIQATGGRRFILGTGCVLPIVAPRANILAARNSVENGY
jgi:uroporphyrinogen decarboxylase